ncbi:agmatine deiminase family protein [Shinella kummerowiae]|uniref:agmatine deiminase family protein n=1 Tax=Shinella kummerowiae TaxID=417745 RepID=UPI0030B7F8F2
MVRTLSSTPKADGFRAPGEFEPKAGCWLIWPERPDTWRLGAKPAQKLFARVAAAIAESEPVTIAVSRRQWLNARAMLPESVRLVEMSTDDSWLRDSGPNFVINDRGDVRGVDWTFNAYGGHDGGLYAPWNLDDLAARKVLETERMDRYRSPLIAEGGGLQCDGEGTLITTEQCLLNRNRNGHLGNGGGGAAALRLSRAGARHLAAARLLLRRDGRPCRRRLLLRAAGRGGDELDGGPRRSAI